MNYSNSIGIYKQDYGVLSDENGDEIRGGLWDSWFNIDSDSPKPDIFDEHNQAIRIKVSEINSLCITEKNKAKKNYLQIKKDFDRENVQ